MSKYKISVLPGDGEGKETIEASLIFLEKLNLNAEYKFGDIGWEFWKKKEIPYHKELSIKAVEKIVQFAGKEYKECIEPTVYKEDKKEK